MPFYLTRDSVPSADMRNVFDNAQNLDLALNDITSSFWSDRLGRSRMSWFGLESAFTVKLSDFESRFSTQIVEQEGIFESSQTDKENRFQQFLLSSGYVFLGDYENGPFQFSARNQYIRYNNQYYRLNAATDVGFTTTGTDATSFASDVTHFVLMDGDTLRQNLSSGDGAKLIGGLSFLTVEMYSYLVEGNDWRKATQAAIDRAHQNYLAGSGPTNILIGGNLIVTLNPDSTLIPGEVAAGRGALCMRSGVTLMGGGSITLDGSFTGSSSGAIITNWEGAADNCKIQGITLNGSRGTAAGTGITCINIVDSDNVTIDNVKALDSTSGGIYLRRANNAVYGCSNSRILNCYVNNVGYIGIQCERPNGMTITGCTVTSCGDNGIDIFGNVTDETGQGIAENVVIANCTVGDISVGIFIESCGNVTISACVIYGFPNSGVFFNRINTAAYNCSVTGCTITGKDITTSQGIRWKNAVGYTRVYNNTLKNCIDSFVTTGGMIYVDIGVNNHENIGRCFLYVPKTSNGCVYTRMAQQVYNGVQTDGIPYNTTPRGWPSANNTRYYRCSFTAPYMMYSATTGEDNLIRATGNLPSNSGWGPAYSLYNTIVSGETVIAMGSSLLSAGEYMLINGYYYLVYSVTSSYAVVRKWDVSSQDYIAGDYTSYLNSAYAYSIFRAAWGAL
ncbi:right-handed parallel beta-helix repeat-containing protein [Klebsiella pneumoniae]|uniref:right-handed parallel beta-helix repeat-containing protein n=1 Tax=Klebsiella pneumoniae TaxID=573 RepID=UPI002ACAA400|nr:right-handed parallel beta-helix repeat-containing protein [Klebsiella pneumoniae]MDZ5677922.1 right-handed parallel beta-helix repeat-containing protein [Klebsiella pneumoniae]